jgi:hypothetical protein
VFWPLLVQLRVPVLPLGLLHLPHVEQQHDLLRVVLQHDQHE